MSPIHVLMEINWEDMAVPFIIVSTTLPVMMDRLDRLVGVRTELGRATSSDNAGDHTTVELQGGISLIASSLRREDDQRFKVPKDGERSGVMLIAA